MSAIGDEARKGLCERWSAMRCSKARQRSRRTTPKFRSIVAIRLFAPGFSSLLLMIFSAAKTTPSLQRMPMDVPPFSTALIAYSTCRNAVRYHTRSSGRRQYLKVSTVRGEDGIRKVVTRANGRLCLLLAKCFMSKMWLRADHISCKVLLWLVRDTGSKRPRGTVEWFVYLIGAR